ncbi:hypothetical protein Acr_00g0035970 [Actinidia rufa]|uniref:Uncharacterized protein n=1 Tax=Actinidia rufa TaxID=165716 RepID=A0A7J0DGU2_9ERIC|nr:hypothetical protein Acr_00g0035970 [Actinidia rufa]
MWCTLHPRYSNGKGMREACLDKVANVQDSDAAAQMQGTSGVVPECVTMWVVNKDGQQIKPEAVILGSCRQLHSAKCSSFIGLHSWQAYVRTDSPRQLGMSIAWTCGMSKLLLCILSKERWLMDWNWFKDRVTRLEALVGASPDETRSLSDRLDAMAEGFLSLNDSQENHVVESATHFTELLDDMTTLLEALRQRLNDVESEI